MREDELRKTLAYFDQQIRSLCRINFYLLVAAIGASVAAIASTVSLLIAAAMIEILAVVDAPHFYAGIVLHDDRVTEAADIVKYMRGWSRDRVRSYCRGKRWKVSVVWRQQRRERAQP